MLHINNDNMPICHPNMCIYVHTHTASGQNVDCLPTCMGYPNSSESQDVKIMTFFLSPGNTCLLTSVLIPYLIDIPIKDNLLSDKYVYRRETLPSVL